METKEYRLEVRALDEKTGEFEGVASVYGVEDMGGDIIEKGAFTKTISERPEVPILWQHDARLVIGLGRLEDTGEQIIVRGQLDMEDPAAANARRKMSKKLVRGLSIGFQTIKSVWEEVEDRYIRHITELKLWEVSVVTFPMLPLAQVTSVKSLAVELKAGRRLSAATRARMEEIISAHQSVIDGHADVMNQLRALLTEDDSAGKAADRPEEAATEPTYHSELSQLVALLKSR